MDIDLTNEPLGTDKAGSPVYLRDVWPSQTEVQIGSQVLRCGRRCSEKHMKNRCEGDERWKGVEAPSGEIFKWDQRQHMSNNRRTSRICRDRRLRRRNSRSASPGGSWGLRHDRSHFTGRLDSGGRPRRQVPDRSWRVAEGFQLLRRAPRQPRSDDARNIRQHPFAQSNGAGHGRRLDGAPSGQNANNDLRCGDAVSERRRPAHTHRRQRIRFRLVARLGGEGSSTPGREGCARGKLRTHPSQQPCRHGSPSAAVQ